MRVAFPVRRELERRNVVIKQRVLRVNQIGGLGSSLEVAQGVCGPRKQALEAPAGNSNCGRWGTKCYFVVTVGGKQTVFVSDTCKVQRLVTELHSIMAIVSRMRSAGVKLKIGECCCESPSGVLFDEASTSTDLAKAGKCCNDCGIYLVY